MQWRGHLSSRQQSARRTLLSMPCPASGCASKSIPMTVQHCLVVVSQIDSQPRECGELSLLLLVLGFLPLLCSQHSGVCAGGRRAGF